MPEDATTRDQGFGPGLDGGAPPDFGQAFSVQDAAANGAAGALPGFRGGQSGGSGGMVGDRGNGAIRGGGREANKKGVPGSPSPSGSGNLGFARKTGNKRVVGAQRSLVVPSVNGNGIVRSYTLSNEMQFNDVDEMQADAISRVYAQEIIEELFVQQWGLDTKDSIAMRKAEDVLHAFIVMRTASPYASYDLSVMIGERQVSMQDMSDMLVTKEVQRRRFARAISDDLKNYILADQNYRLRNILSTTLGIYPQYVHLAFDGSTHCSGLNRHEIAFTKALESSKLFDDQNVQGKLANVSLLDGVFDSGASADRKRVRV